MSWASRRLYSSGDWWVRTFQVQSGPAVDQLPVEGARRATFILSVQPMVSRVRSRRP